MLIGFGIFAAAIFLVFWPFIIWCHIKKHTAFLEKQTQHLSDIKVNLIVIREELQAQIRPSTASPKQ
jgi:hypothetical protein